MQAPFCTVGGSMVAKLEQLIAQTILQGFDAQYGRFLEVTAGAQHRFEQADWHAVQQAMKSVFTFMITMWV